MSKPLSGRTLGYVGLGRMGRAMVGNLVTAGAQLTVWNRTPGVVTPSASLRIAESAGAVAVASEIVIINVSDTPAVEAVLLGPGGILENLLPGKLVMDMGTTAYAATRAFAARVAERRADYVDAPVSGGVVGAEDASLAIMVGASAQAFGRVRPVLETLGSNVVHCGEVGAGQVAKTANQMIVGLTISAVAEAFALGRAAGVESAKLRQALRGGFADSRILELHGQRMAEGAFAPGGRIALQWKDIRQALDLAEQLGIDLPGTTLNETLWQKMIDRGWGDLDHSALIKLYEG
jgi:3-hydroxyisobutyrate dehydrogenase-like beta-hydroxyacid dehydrogenase